MFDFFNAAFLVLGDGGIFFLHFIEAHIPTKYKLAKISKLCWSEAMKPFDSVYLKLTYDIAKAI